MKAKTHVQPEVPAAPIPVVSQPVLAPTSVAVENDVVTNSQIQDLAYKLYEGRGRVDGCDLQDWFEAESILRERGRLAS